MTPGATVKGLLDLIMPGAVGAAGGGVAGAGLARRRVRRDLDPLRREVGELAQRVLGGVDEPGCKGSVPAGTAPSDKAQTAATGTEPDSAAMRELERVR